MTIRITRIVEQPIRLHGDIANALVNFSQHTVSLVAVHTDAVRDGRPVVGIAFNSIGRFAQTGILRDRMIPRVLAADPDGLVDRFGVPSPSAVLACALRDEKPGGHGDRATAAGGLELAIWDVRAKLADEPAYATIAREAGRPVPEGEVPVYAAGGYYYPDDGVGRLRDEVAGHLDAGYTSVKMKIGGASIGGDLARIEAVLDVVGDAGRVAVDANGRFALDDALVWADALAPYGLRWFEEVGDPLDLHLNSEVTARYDGPVATGENLFSAQDVANLVRYGGMRPGRDIFQMDPGLSYGITEYLRMLDILEAGGFDRAFAFPHGGHLVNLHVVAALGLGGCESYPGVFQPFGGYGRDATVVDGRIRVPDAPGFGLEYKDGMAELIAQVSA